MTPARGGRSTRGIQNRARSVRSRCTVREGVSTCDEPVRRRRRAALSSPPMSVTPRLIAALGAWLGLAAVMAGAFGAHALRARLDANHLQTFETAVRYQMIHALALIASGLASERALRPSANAGLLLLIG